MIVAAFMTFQRKHSGYMVPRDPKIQWSINIPPIEMLNWAITHLYPFLDKDWSRQLGKTWILTCNDVTPVSDSCGIRFRYVVWNAQSYAKSVIYPNSDPIAFLIDL